MRYVDTEKGHQEGVCKNLKFRREAGTNQNECGGGYWKTRDRRRVLVNTLLVTECKGLTPRTVYPTKKTNLNQVCEVALEACEVPAKTQSLEGLGRAEPQLP